MCAAAHWISFIPIAELITRCEPYPPYPRANRQGCTRSHHNDGTLLFASVYYVDENGMWYRIQTRRSTECATEHSIRVDAAWRIGLDRFYSLTSGRTHTESRHAADLSSELPLRQGRGGSIAGPRTIQLSM